MFQVSRQKGFALTEIVLLIVITAAVIGLGLYVVLSTQNTDKLLNSTKINSGTNSNSAFISCAKKTGAALDETRKNVICTDAMTHRTYSHAAYPPIKTSAESVIKSNWQNAPTALQQAITKLWPSDCSATDQPSALLNEPGNILVSSDGKTAEAGLGCAGGAAFLFVNNNGTWRDVAHTQLAFGCETIDMYQIPIGLLGPGGARCFDQDNIERQVVTQ